MKDLENGFKINEKYSIVKKQGNGSLGTAIYLGQDIEKDCQVIIRIIPPELLHDKEMISRFMQGAELTKKLKHPNILELLDAGEFDETRYLVTSYEKGFFLDDYLEHRGILDENESIRLIKSLASALDYAWEEQQIIHRNISPDTILVAKGNVPMLTDFDLAKSMASDSKLTMEGFTVGEPKYMSPEQARGEEVDFHSDIYCLGLVLYNLLAGDPPFYDKSRLDILHSQISDKHPPIQGKNKNISDECSSVLDKMLEKKIEGRYSSWSQLINDLDAVLNKKAPSTMPTEAGAEAESSVTSKSSYKMQAVQIMEKPTIEEKAPETPNLPKGSLGLKLFFIFVVILVVIPIIHMIRNQDTSEEITEPASNIVLDVKEVPEFPDPKPEPPKIEPVKPEPVKPAPSVTDKAREESNKKASLNNIKQISVALQMYANVFEDKYPEPNGAKGLDLLRVNGFLTIPQVFVCPGTGNISAVPGKPITEDTCDYVYVGGLSTYSEGDTPILWSKPKNHKDFGHILYVNGEVKAVSGNNWLNKTKKKIIK